MTPDPVRSPVIWFGGKRRAAELIWQRLGDVANFIDPFMGSLAVLLARPSAPRIETVNDQNAYLACFWRAVAAVPEAGARDAGWPVNEADLHPRHRWLVQQGPALRERVMGDPEYFDAKIAGWWIWGLSQWIGSGWCDPKVQTADRTEQKRPVVSADSHGRGVVALKMSRPELGSPGRRHGGKGVHKSSLTEAVVAKRPHLGASGSGSGSGVHAIGLQAPRCNGLGGQGIHGAKVSTEIRTHQKMPKVGLNGSGDQSISGVNSPGMFERGIYAWFTSLQGRLRRVRVCCGDWTRIMGDSVIYGNGITGILLDPPYDGHADLYAGGNEVWREVVAWALAHGDDPRLRIILCGYEGTFEAPKGWETVPWKANGGYGNVSGNLNKHRERLWCSPACERPVVAQQALALGVAS